METTIIKDFYDSFAKEQVKTGINERHHLILELALTNGLKDGMRVLELGCGIGTLTGLLAERLPNGHLVAMDLSPESIAHARSFFIGRTNVELRVADVVSDPLGGPYDLIVLPDILEHIPLVRHNELFQHLREALQPNGRILVHSPDPFYSEWLRKNRPGSQQVVDLALHLPELVATFSQAGLCLLHYQRHSIWTEQPDYMAFSLVHVPVDPAFTPIESTTSWAARSKQVIKKALKKVFVR